MVGKTIYSLSQIFYEFGHELSGGLEKCLSTEPVEKAWEDRLP